MIIVKTEIYSLLKKPLQAADLETLPQKFENQSSSIATNAIKSQCWFRQIPLQFL